MFPEVHFQSHWDMISCPDKVGNPGRCFLPVFSPVREAS